MSGALRRRPRATPGPGVRLRVGGRALRPVCKEGRGGRRRGPGQGRHRCFASGGGGGGGRGPAGLYKRPRAPHSARLAAKTAPTCLRVPCRAGSPPAGRRVLPAGPRRPHGVPAGKSRLSPAGAGLGGARSGPQQLTVRAQPRPARLSAPPRSTVSASPGRGAGHVPAGVGPRGGVCGEGGQGASS